ncbi:Uncharacterized conserved protein YloU, alkaline shock protein (Asp23) family [Glycomyces sambucus]|uniref:Uncharacterized conserved protein YloU, alkaline shock protein (Asp23) family n=1 Tax=Glycomyces sambucus TaxID=380244 RepID=A0A1G9HVM1_9ACTN|nr:hypothetical protein [Glycomyces sambucus]SDL16856.1 Uncharacterized conserved protein YloU, alkaline shock protein (Asp23) family [Glycomyces sambucus]
MTDDAFALADLPGSGADRPPEERGSLRLSDTAVAHILEGAARTCEGTAASKRPRAKATVSRGRIWASLDVGVEWPGPVSGTARELARRVRAETARITGYDVVAVDVAVHLVDAPVQAERRVR